MRQLVNSVNRFAWAMSLFGVQQLANTLAPTRAGGGRASGGFDSVTRAAEGQLGEPLGTVFRAGDQIQRGMVDLTFDMLTLQALTPGGMLRSVIDLTRRSADVARLLAPGRDSRLAWQEFRNKLEAYGLFDGADLRLGVRDWSATYPAELVERAAALGPYHSVWATEGAGHFYAHAVWERAGAPRGLLSDAAARRTPARGLAALHAGMGIAFASRVLQTVGWSGDRHALRRALERFVALCRENSRPGYIGAAYEALGLTTRNLHPQLIGDIEDLLPEGDEDLPGYFWHGVGRAIYFAPTNLPPCASSMRRAVEMSQREPPHEAGRRNALAGLAWALTLVNIRHPEIIESLLARDGARLADTDAFPNGVASALVIWRDSTQDIAPLAAWRGHQPGASDPRTDELWKLLVSGPSEEALQRIYPALAGRGRLGEVFRYQPLERLVTEAEGEAACPAVRGAS